MSGVCKQPLRALKAGILNSLVIGVIINSQNARTFDASRTKFNKGERAVWTFTLRDSEEDFVNVTVWGSVNFINKLFSTFAIGSVEIINPKISVRESNERDEMFNPSVSVPFKFTVNEGSGLIQQHDAPTVEVYRDLLHIPPKKFENLYTLKTILEEMETMRDQYIDLVLVVTFVSEIRNVITRDGRTLKCRNFEATDGSSESPVSLTLWESMWVERAASWQPRFTVLSLADARIVYDNFRKKIVIGIVRKTLITENPNFPQTSSLRTSTSICSREIVSVDCFSVPNPNTIATVMTIEQISERLNQNYTMKPNERLQFATIVTAIVTDMNLDNSGPTLVNIKCALCKQLVTDNRDSCMNLDCPSGNGSRVPFNTISINVKVNLKDDTGYLIGCRLNGDAAERAFGCTATDFQKMTISERANLKWKFILEKCEIRLQILGPTSLFPRAMYNILSMRVIQEDEIVHTQLGQMTSDF